MGGHFVYRFVPLPFFGMGAHQLGNNITCLLHGHYIPQHDPLFPDEIQVVERRPGDSSACQADGIQHRGGGENTGAAHSYGDIPEDGLFLFGREFVGRFYGIVPEDICNNITSFTSGLAVAALALFMLHQLGAFDKIGLWKKNRRENRK